MEQRNNKKPTFDKIRKKFYKQVAENDKNEKKKLIISALVVLLLASILLFSASLVETSGKGKYVYLYGNYEQSIRTDVCFVDGNQLIDMNALANYCGFEKEDENAVSTFSVNNTYVTFENNSKIATINGIKKEMPTKAQIKNGYCLVPMSTVAEIVFGIEIQSIKNSTNITKIAENMYIIDRNPEVEYSTDVSQYLEYINSNDEYIFTLLNKQNPIDEEFEPDDLVAIPSAFSRKDKTIYLQSTAMMALEAMFNNMVADGITDAYIQSSYRSHSYQAMLFNMYIEDEMANGLSREEAEIKANKYSARPEYSEHRTGLAVDFTTKSIGGAVDDIFETTEAFTWLKANSWKYGFVLRYPEDKESTTGYMYESWHYRFVGLEVASIMYQTGLCYEEYLAIFGAK